MAPTAPTPVCAQTGPLKAGGSVANYPARPIRLIVPVAPGGAADITGRLLATELVKQMRQQVFVENRPGSSGIIGFEAIARAAPDGYTIGLATFNIATNPSTFAKLPYDALRDFQMVIQLTSGVNLLAIHPKLPITSVPELRDYARKSPGKLMFGSSGNGTSMRVSMELFKQMTATDLVHVPYKGIAQAITDAMSGHIHIICDNMGSIYQHVKSGHMRALGVTSRDRSKIAPDVPTIAEQGLHGYEFTPWSGYMVPALVPRAIVLRLNSEIEKAIRLPAMDERFRTANGSTPVGGTPEFFAEHVRNEIAKWGRVLWAAGVRPE